MATTRRNHCYVDFTQEPEVGIFAKNTHAVVTGADNQEDFFWVGGRKYFELIQTGQNDQLPLTGFTPAATGWLVPIDAAGNDGIEITRGIISGSAQSFIVGTDDPFFIRVGGYVGTIANHQHIMAGFRLLAAYEDAATDAQVLTAYNEKAVLGAYSDGGAGTVTAVYSKATVNSTVAATHAAYADATWWCVECKVGATGAVTWRIGTSLVSYADAKAALAADTLLTATAFSFTDAVELVPTIILSSNGTAISDVSLIEFECGYQGV
jgi:hypothetical protein